MVIGFQIRKLHRGGGIRPPPPAVLDSKRPGLFRVKEKYTEKKRKYKNAYNRLLHASTGASTVGVVSGVSTIGTAFTVVGLPISASLGVVSTVSTCVGACLLLTSKKYKKKLLKCYELLDRITSSLATYETLISLSIDDGSVIDAKEFHKLQTLYLQLMAHVRNIDRKMKVETEQNFQNTIMDEITNLKRFWNKSSWLQSMCVN